MSDKIIEEALSIMGDRPCKEIIDTTVEKYWPGSLTWPEIVERIRSWSDGPITRDEAYEVMQVASVLGVFMRREEKQVSEQEKYIPSLGAVSGPAPSTHRVSAEPLVIPTVEQMQLIASILDGLIKTIPPLMPHYDEIGMVNLGKCRYCGVVGQIHNVFEVRHEHTDECLLALNDRLQKSMQGVVTSQHTEEQEL